MDKYKLIVIVIILCALTMYVVTDHFIDKEEGTNVYHFKGENYNHSVNYGDIRVSPQLSDNIFFLALGSLVVIGATISLLFSLNNDVKGEPR